jgi:hypothetical protein
VKDIGNKHPTALAATDSFNDLLDRTLDKVSLIRNSTHQVVLTMTLPNVNVSDHQVRVQYAGSAEHPPITINDARRSIRHEIAGDPSDISTNDRHAALQGASDVAGTSLHNYL